jgi:hydroxymethylpyrimidine/phosphomethylpyrimidine kinase
MRQLSQTICWIYFHRALANCGLNMVGVCALPEPFLSAKLSPLRTLSDVYSSVSLTGGSAISAPINHPEHEITNLHSYDGAMTKDAARPRKQSAAAPDLPARKVALTVAGFDPSSGAGITADLKVLTNHGLYGVAAITALTVQSTQGVQRVEPVPATILSETLACLAADLPLAGVKIGMLATAENVRAVARFLRESAVPRNHVVLDPVLVSSSGADLLEPAAVRILRDELLPVVGWITPNVDELAVLAAAATPRPTESSSAPSRPPHQPAPLASGDIPALAHRLAELASGLNIVVTGGHLDPPHDFLLTADGASAWFPGSRIHTTSTHGTGCVFSSALLSRILAGDPPPDAVRAAKAFVTHALQTAAPLGKGKGPVL